MKVAITVFDDSLESKIDSRFGRCSFFAIYDTNTKATHFIQNPNKDKEGGAGPASAEFVSKMGIYEVYSGEFGGKVVPIFNELNIKMIHVYHNEITVGELINSFKI